MNDLVRQLCDIGINPRTAEDAVSDDGYYHTWEQALTHNPEEVSDVYVAIHHHGLRRRPR